MACRPPAHHEPLDDALFFNRGGIQRDPVSAGIIQRHAHHHQECHQRIQPKALTSIDQRHSQHTCHLDEKANDDIGFAMPQPEQVDAVAQHTKEDLDHEWDQSDRADQSDFAHAQSK